MKKKSYLALLVLAGVMVTTSVGSITALADGDSQSSEATITFETNSDGKAVAPVDPEYMDKKIIPKDGGAKNGTGNLTIDYIANFRFPNGVITQEAKTYYGKPKEVEYEGGQEVTIPNSVQVTDNRGNKDGWTLKVARTDFRIMDDTNGNAGKIILGAKLSLHNMEVNSLVNTADCAWASIYPAGNTMEIGTSGNIVMAAKANEGMGTYAAMFGKTRNGGGTLGDEDDPTSGERGVSLAIGANTQLLAEEEYVATLTWTLEDTYTGE